MTASTNILEGSGRAERELVLLCARLELDGVARERFRILLDEPLDWAEVLELTGFHHVTPLLYRHVAELGPGTTPAWFRSTLWSRHVASTAHQLKLMGELVSLSRALESAGAPTVVWKGPVLAHTLYPSPDLRTFSDLDLIVRQEDALLAQRVLRDRGYALKEGMTELEVRGPDQDAPMWNRELGVAVDLHWGAVRRYRSSAMDCERLWAESEPIKVPGGTVQGLKPGEMLRALALHGAKHTPFPWPGLKWVTDMEAYLRVKPPTWWPPVLERARKEGCLRMVLLGLSLAQEILEAPVPPPVASALAKDDAVGNLVPDICRRLMDPGDAHFSLGRRIAFDLSVRERLRDRVVYRMVWLFTPSARDADPHGSTSFGWLRIPLRLLRLGRTYLLRPSALRALIRGSESREGRGEE